MHDFPDTYTVLGADLSLKRPGFCLLTVKRMDGKTSIENVELYCVDNKNKKKPHGQLLNEILVKYTDIVSKRNNLFAVRETEIMKQKVPSERSLSKVVGIMDLAYWNSFGKEWDSIYPSTVKKLITGNGRAEKDEVAAMLKEYIGPQEYKCDDESDAAAVAVAWLIQQGQIKQKENPNG